MPHGMDPTFYRSPTAPPLIGCRAGATLSFRAARSASPLLTQVQAQEFNADGTLDPPFTSQPFSYTVGEPGGQDTPGAIAIEPNGKIVIAGTHFLSDSAFGVARLKPNGTPDTTFVNGGVLTTRFQAATGPQPYSSSPTGTSSPPATRRAPIPPSATSPWPANSGRDAASLVTHRVC
jgi:hypothetical protein